MKMQLCCHIQWLWLIIDCDWSLMRVGSFPSRSSVRLFKHNTHFRHKVLEHFAHHRQAQSWISMKLILESQHCHWLLDRESQLIQFGFQKLARSACRASTPGSQTWSPNSFNLDFKSLPNQSVAGPDPNLQVRLRVFCEMRTEFSWWLSGWNRLWKLLVYASCGSVRIDL